MTPSVSVPERFNASAFFLDRHLAEGRGARTAFRYRDRSVTYAEVAASVGRPGAARAVGSACGANPVAVVIPFHRVIRADGSSGNYKRGVDRKRALLAREARGDAP